MASLHSQAALGLSAGSIILTRHHRCITTGLLGSHRSPWLRTDRGGGPTYHDQGQITCYPIIKLENFNIRPAEYTHMICTWIYTALGAILHKKERRYDKLSIIENGIWLNQKKIAFIGTRIKRGVSLHGFSINLFSNLGGFANFNPCDKSGMEVGNFMVEHQEVVDSLIEYLPFI